MVEPLSGYAGFLERCRRPDEEIEAACRGPYKLSERQAKAILDMRLQRLTGLERKKIKGEYALCELIARLEAILADSALLMKVIRDELSEIRSEYGDGRRTEIQEAVDDIEPIDLVADEAMVVMITRNGYIKRLPMEECWVQGRGGKGVKGGGGRDSGGVLHSEECCIRRSAAFGGVLHSETPETRGCALTGKILFEPKVVQDLYDFNHQALFAFSILCSARPGK